MEAIELSLFKNLRDLRKEITLLTDRHLDALNIFHLKAPLVPTRADGRQISGFRFQRPAHDDKTARLSLSSTATCVRSLLHCREAGIKSDIDATPLQTAILSRHSESKLNTSGLSHLNPFTVSLVLPLCKTIGLAATESVVADSLEVARTELKKGGVRMDDYLPNGYLSYWMLRGVQEYSESLPREAEETIRWCETEFYRQCVLFTSGSDDESDAVQLGFTLLVLWRYRQESGLSMAVLAKGLDLLFSSLLERGVWEKRDCLFVYATRGDAYCFAFELLTALLEEFSGNEVCLYPHWKALERSFAWIRRNQHEIDGVPCWRSGNLAHSREPESWATAEVMLFLQLFRDLVSFRIEDILLSEFRGRGRSTPLPKFADFLIQPDVELDGEEPKLLLEVFEERLIQPLEVGSSGVAKYSLVGHRHARECARSGILFGPPGTGKTTFVKQVADRLGWPLFILDPSNFAVRGLPFIAGTTAEIFDYLLELENSVIFFDEMEELIRSREGEKSGSFEQKFMTTSFLPKLQELHDRATCIFFVATNHIDAIDLAARREGRFDFQLQILPAIYSEKVRLIQRSELSKILSTALIGELAASADLRDKIRWCTRLELQWLLATISLLPNAGGIRPALERFKPRLGDPVDWAHFEGMAKQNQFHGWRKV